MECEALKPWDSETLSFSSLISERHEIKELDGCGEIILSQTPGPH